MEANVFIDVQLIRDHTYRWVWLIRGDHAIYGAGVCMSQTDAQAAGEHALGLLQDRERAKQPAARGPDWQTDTLNLDELERADREQREQRGRDRRRAAGHTEESDPANLGGG